MVKLFFFIVTTLIATATTAQGTDQQLAEHYYSKGEFDKAVSYYAKLYEREPNKFFVKRYVECLTATGENKEAEKVLKREASRNKDDLEYQILLAKFYEDNGDAEKGLKIYRDLIENVRPSSREVINLYNAFKAQGKNELAYETLVQGRKLLKNSYPLNFQFAEYYGSIGETEKMIQEYLDLLDYHSSYSTSLQRILANQIDFTQEDSKEYEILKQALIERTQKNPSDLVYAEMLTWLFIQRQNFSAALVHVKAIDKRTNAGGRIVFDLGQICVENKDFRTARKAFEYVIELGEGESYFIQAQNAILNVLFLEVTTLRNFTPEELNTTIVAYESALEKYGTTRNSINLVLELAHIQAFYAGKGADAIELLNEAMAVSSLTDMQRAEVKMLLGDIHVLHGDVWEASLLYMQVDSDFKFEPIGHEAKFKNARIFYYDGEFDFAQSQLDILKQSTSKLIANDALKLSLLITENYGLDSNYIAMNWFANGDLLIEQHRYNEAFVLFDSIIKVYPAHSLGDEILLKKSRAMQLQGQWMDAVAYLEELLKYYKSDILADDALFQLAEIYENNLMDSAKAAEYYRQILFDHKGSLYTEEARKRFKTLRSHIVDEEIVD